MGIASPDIGIRIRRKAYRVWRSALASARNNGVKAYWCDFENFGDQITPLLLRYYKFTALHSSPDAAQVVSTGSILEHIPEDYTGLVIGSGLISGNSRRAFPKARIVAVRGRLTQERLGLGSKRIKLGDPGLLAATLLKKREEKMFVLGVIPHYVDKANAAFANLLHSNKKKCKIIDVETKDSMDVIRQIDQCESIISSSLHGLIVADSLGIPNSWMYSPGLTGGRFKFDDYYSSLGVPNQDPEVIAGTETLRALVRGTTTKPGERIHELAHGLDIEFSALREHLL